MAALLRRKGQPPPVYCEGGGQFSVEVHHGGIFVGSGNLRSYVDEKIDFFDELEVETWSFLWFDDFVQQLGYKKDDKIRFHWLLPGLPFPDGLRILLEDKDTNAMADIVHKVTNFVVYFDHVNTATGINWDDIVADEMAEIPRVQNEPEKDGQKIPVFYTNLQNRTVLQVLVRDYQHIVDLTAKTCDCRRWQLTGIPCCHAVSCLRHEKIPPESVLPSCYSLDAYNRAYANSIWPCKDKSQWEKMNGPEVLPPFYEKRAGRPPKARKKQAHEVPGRNGPRLSKHGVTMHCSHCSDGGHNKAGCRLKKMGFNSEEAKALVATTQATTQLEAQEEAMRAAADQVNENETPDALNISSTQPPSLVEMTQASSSVLSEMLGEETHESSLSQPQGPLPDPIFIMSNQPVQRPTPLTTSTAAGRAALSKKRSSTSQKTSSKKAKTPTGASSKTGT